MAAVTPSETPGETLRRKVNGAGSARGHGMLRRGSTLGWLALNKTAAPEVEFRADAILEEEEGNTAVDGSLPTGKGQGPVSPVEGVIHPESNYAVYWSVWTLLLILYGMVMIPLRLAFNLGEELKSPVVICDLLIDFCFLIDMMVQSRLAFRSAWSNDYVFDRKKIRRRYLRSWFLFDLMAALPFDFVRVLLDDSSSGGQTGQNLVVTRLFKSFRLMRVAKLAKVSRIKSLMETVDRVFNLNEINPGVRRMFTTTFFVSLLCHFTACVWFYSSVSADDGERSGWVFVYMSDEYEAGDLWAMYVAALYWSVSTLTSVGFGDFEPQTNAERLVAILSCWVGATVFGYVIGQMSNMVADLNQAAFKFHRKMDSINAYLKYRRVPTALQRRIRRFFRYYTSRKLLFDEEQILNDLTHGLRAELSSFLSRDVLKEINIFRGIENPSFMSAIVTMLKPFSAAPGDIIFREGDHANEMYIVVHGVVQAVGEDGVVFGNIGSGSHFGEITHIHAKDGDERRACTVRAVTHCDLFSISKEDVANVSENFPEVHDQIEATTRGRIAEARNLRMHHKARKVTTGHTDDIVNPFESMPANPTGTRIVTRQSMPEAERRAITSERKHSSTLRSEMSQLASGRGGSIPDYTLFMSHQPGIVAQRRNSASSTGSCESNESTKHSHSGSASSFVPLGPNNVTGLSPIASAQRFQQLRPLSAPFKKPGEDEDEAVAEEDEEREEEEEEEEEGEKEEEGSDGKPKELPQLESGQRGNGVADIDIDRTFLGSEMRTMRLALQGQSKQIADLIEQLSKPS